MALQTNPNLLNSSRINASTSSKSSNVSQNENNNPNEKVNFKLIFKLILILNNHLLLKFVLAELTEKMERILKIVENIQIEVKDLHEEQVKMISKSEKIENALADLATRFEKFDRNTVAQNQIFSQVIFSLNFFKIQLISIIFLIKFKGNY